MLQELGSCSRSHRLKAPAERRPEGFGPYGLNVAEESLEEVAGAKFEAGR